METDVSFVDRVAEIRDYMQDVVTPDQLDFREWGRLVHETKRVSISCKTPACLAGHICAYYDHEVQSAIRFDAAQLLGLSFQQSVRLFQPTDLPDDITWDRITPEHVVMVLDNFIETGGVVDWSIIAE